MDIDITAACQKCGDILEYTHTMNATSATLELQVEQCGSCLEEAREEGKERASND